MKFGIALALTCSALLPVSASADEVYAVTPTGSAEMLFAGKPEDVIGKLSGRCIDSHWSVTSSTATELVCEAPLNFGQSVLGQMLMGNSYSTPPRRFFKFNAATVGGVSRVQASGWMELQMAFGQMKRTDFAGAQFQNGMMVFMLAAGGKFPVGTTFPNHAYLGFEYKPEPQGKTSGLLVTAIDEGKAGNKAGLAAGDVIISIAGKKFKNNDDILEAFERAAKTTKYPISIMRGGQQMVLTAEREYKAASTEVVTPETTAGLSTSAGQPGSLADELAKLAKLKADGVLTDSEFQAQKAKLLAK